jgi:hypothetical protein
MWLFFICLAIYLTYEVAKQGGELYYFEPGLAEHIVSFAVFYLLGLGIVAILKRL